MAGTGDCNGLVLQQRKRGDVGGDLGCDHGEVLDLALADYKSLQFGNV
jgi:hypothetical protein